MPKQDDEDEITDKMEEIIKIVLKKMDEDREADIQKRAITKGGLSKISLLTSASKKMTNDFGGLNKDLADRL